MGNSLYIGIMSGTSLDGIDLALTHITHNTFSLIKSQCVDFPESLRKALLSLCQQKQCSLQTLGELDHQLGLCYANVINHFLAQTQYTAADIQAIGCHGQTIYHSPYPPFPFTMQIGDANIIAAHTGITTVADFRRKDMAYGGQGAPLVPAFHQKLFAAQNKFTVVANIGGIANITILHPDYPLLGYDTGPGNVLLDCWTQQHLNLSYDKNGAWAATGKVNKRLLQKLLDDPYINQPYPKSTGREYFNLSWLQNQLTRFSLSAKDIQATLVEFTAHSIIKALDLFKHNLLPQTFLVCGGGAKNKLLMQRLTEHLSNWTVKTTNDAGLDCDYVEAAAFAWLAFCRLQAQPSNCPTVTGATNAVSLGVIYPYDRPC